MTECFSARCQQDRKLARREFNKWTKNLLLQIGLETIAKNHFEFDVRLFESKEKDFDSSSIDDFNPQEICLFCSNRQEPIGNKKFVHRSVDFVRSTSTILNFDDEENAPLDLSIKSSKINSISNRNVKPRTSFDVKSDIPTVCKQDEFDRLMTEFIAGQMAQNLDLNEAQRKFPTADFSSNPFFNLNLFAAPTIDFSTRNSMKNSSTQHFQIEHFAKQMALTTFLEQIDAQRNSTNNNKNYFHRPNSPTFADSFNVNQILNDVMTRILNEIFEKSSTNRAERKGELLFVKKQNFNNEEQNFNGNSFKKQFETTKKTSSSSSSTTSSGSSSSSISVHSRAKHKSKKSSTSKNSRRAARQREILANNTKILIGTDGKQIRPKRGQYRRYESEQLAKAVAAVLSNEMSVHKAGSFFGVPHSTLEYKVKERNIKSSSNKSKSEGVNLVESETMNNAQNSSFLSFSDEQKTNRFHDEDQESDELSTSQNIPMDSSSMTKSIEI